MGNPEDERTIINVKGVSAPAWERAKKAANKQGQAMGAWLSRAINQLADAEDGPREFPPLPVGNPPPEMGNLSPPAGNPEGMTADQLAAVMQGLAAVAASSWTLPTKVAVRRIYSLVDDHVREAKRLPPAPVRLRSAPSARKAVGQSLPRKGKTALIEDQTD